MFYPGNYVFNPYLIPPLTVGLLIGVLGLTSFVLERRSLASFVFFILTSVIMLWMLSYVAIFCSANRLVALPWIRLEIVFVALIPTMVYVFSLSLVSRLDRFRGLAWGSFGMSLFFILSILVTDDFVSGVYEYWWGYYAKFGPLATAFLVFFFLVLVASLEILWSEYRRAPTPRRKKRMRWLILAFCIGYFGSVDFLATYGLPVYPFGYLPILGFLVLCAVTIKHFRLVDITPALAAGQIINIMTDALLVLDVDGAIQFMNRSASELFGDATGPQFEDLLARLRRGDRLRDFEVAFPAAGRRTLSFSASVMLDEDKRPVAYVLIARDVTERKEADRALFEKNVELERQRAELDQLELFAFVASHDLQEPLRKIMTFSSRLRAEAKETLNEKGQDYLQRMEGAAERMSRYLSDIVEFSRVATKANRFEPVQLNSVLKEVLMDLELRVTELSADVRVEGLPVVSGDRLQIRQLFQNLLVNALKFHREEAKPVVVIRDLGGRDGFARISVEDNGIGFDEKFAEKIFNPFERLHSRDEYEGSGMGLAICKRIVTRHGGRIHVRSAPGKGSTFLLDLPLVS